METYRKYFNLCHCVNLYYFNVLIYIEDIAFDPLATIEVLYVQDSFPVLLFWLSAKVNHGHLRFQP